VWFANKEQQISYLLAKRALKGAADPRQTSILRELLAEVGKTRSETIATSLFGDEDGMAVLQAIESDRLQPLLPRLAASLRRPCTWRRPAGCIRYWLPELRRRWRRWRTSTGLMLVVLGPDGCGKNTLIERIGVALRDAFRGQHHFHWRPGALIPLKQTDEPEPFPHRRQKRGALLSSLYAAGFQLDYWFGYCARIYPALTRSGLVFFNRYHYDMQVDSRRYRYGGPQWLIENFSRLLPGTPLVLILDGDPHRIYDRKPELSLFELQRQRMDYRRLAGRLQQAHVLDANLPPEAVARQALHVIAEYLTRRNLSCYPDWFAPRMKSAA
jgi:thymidylate kinase